MSCYACGGLLDHDGEDAPCVNALCENSERGRAVARERREALTRRPSGLIVPAPAANRAERRRAAKLARRKGRR